MSSTTAITAIGTTLRHIFSTMKVARTRTTLA